jgi:diacylglycerol O-acyltransferase
MAATDALFWYAETALPIFRPIIAGLYLLDRQPDAARRETAHDAVIAVVPRLRQRVVEPASLLGMPQWVEDAHFDHSYHVRHLSVPAPGTVRELLDITAALFATPLDRERPLWEAYWIDGLQDGRAAYFFKMHHSLVDGVGSLAIMNALTQRRRRDAVPRVARMRTGSAQEAAPAATQLAAVLENVREVAALAGRAAGAPLRILAQPEDSADQMRRLVRGFRGILTEINAPAVHDPLSGSTSGLSRRFDVMDIPLARLDAIRKPLGVTLNDLILAVLAGTLGAYHRQRRVHSKTLVCMVPMSLRGQDEQDTLGNRVGMFNIGLPVAERRPECRLTQIVRQTQAAKRDRRSALYPFFVQALTVLPAGAFRWLARQSLGRVNVACTNIPGVPERRYLAGAAVDAVFPFASVVQGTPLVIALFSYAGIMDIGIDTDPEAIPDPHRISQLFRAHLDEMAGLAEHGVRISAGP